MDLHADFESFKKPDFIRPEIETYVLGVGLDWVVHGLENLPREVREKVPDGFVVKQLDAKYGFASAATLMFQERKEEFLKAANLGDFEKLFKEKHGRLPKDEEIIEAQREAQEKWDYAVHTFFEEYGREPDLDNRKDVGEVRSKLEGGRDYGLANMPLTEERVAYLRNLITPQGIAGALAERQKFYEEFYGKELPHLIVHHDYVVGNGEDKKPHIYAFQEKIESGISLGNIINYILSGESTEDLFLGNFNASGNCRIRVHDDILPDRR